MEIAKSDNGRWKPGQSGNLNGRPVGHRTRQQFSAQFLADLSEVWATEGKQTMLATARAQPETFFAVCSRLIPKDVELTIRQHTADLDPGDLFARSNKQFRMRMIVPPARYSTRYWTRCGLMAPS